MIIIAERRMFAKSIVLSDAFLDMPMSARCLYFTLGMFADDDGFVNSPRGIMRQCGASDDDMKVLIAKKFVLVFESGVIVIKHWRINNYLQKDRYNETKYLKEKKSLSIDKNGSYHNHPMYTQGVYTQDRLVKDSIGKNSINNISPKITTELPQTVTTVTPVEAKVIPQNETWFDEFWGKYPKKLDKCAAVKSFAKKCKSENDLKEILAGLENWKSYWKDPKYIPYPSKFLNHEYYKENPKGTESESDPLSFLPF